MKRDPLWTRHGFQSDQEYKAACAATRATRKAAFLNTRSKGAHQAILRAIWDKADFHRPVVTITREQIIEKTGCSLSTVRRALIDLRTEGSIKPIRNWKGGRSIPTTWLLSVPGQSNSPSDQHIAAREAEKAREAAWRFLSGKYGPAKALEIMDAGGEA